MLIDAFQHTVLGYYHAHGRHDLPWRQPDANGMFDSYQILVSEIMLQQTQVSRVIPKFQNFMQRFPAYAVLAAAPLSEVLKEWSGLGYNRRAKFLWQAAQKIVQDYDGVLPRTTAELATLPGIGVNTAGALLAYTYNLPVIFIETNIRTVFIYHFFAGREQVSDKEIADLVALTLPGPAPGRAAGDLGLAQVPRGEKPARRVSYREWYWGLMDYGTYLKQTVGNPNIASKHYVKQSPFKGSRRQVRGQVLRFLGAGPATLMQLQQYSADERLQEVLAALVAEGMITKSGTRYTLYDV